MTDIYIGLAFLSMSVTYLVSVNRNLRVRLEVLEKDRQDKAMDELTKESERLGLYDKENK